MHAARQQFPFPPAQILTTTMKTTLLLLAAACLLLPSCGTQGQPRLNRLDPVKVAALGNLALTVANSRGAISDKDAALARKAGVLLLATQTADNPLATISEAAVATAVQEGSLTQAEADLLHEAGSVPLKAPDPGPANPLLPPVE